MKRRRPRSRRSTKAMNNRGNQPNNGVKGSRRRNTRSRRKGKGNSKRKSNSKRKGQNGGSPAYRFHQSEGFLSQLSDFPRDLPLFQEGDGTNQGYYQVSV